MVSTAHPIEPEEVMTYLDGEAPTDRAATIAAHLESCPDCAELAAGFRLVSKRLMAWEVEPAPLRPVEGTPRRVITWKAASVVGLAAAAAMVALIVRVPSPLTLGSQAGGPRGVAVDTVRTKAPDDAFIVQVARLALTTTDFATVRERLEALVRRHHGHIAELTLNAPPEAGRTLDASLKIPASDLDAALVELRKLGRVESESRTGEDVTKQYVDLDARLTNARNTEQRLSAMLRQAGKVTDLLEVEKEIDRVRGEIEQMDAEKRTLSGRVEFATIAVRIAEEYKARLGSGPGSAGTRLGNAAVAGFRNVTSGILAAAEFLLEYGLSILLWGAILYFPARFLWKRRSLLH